MNSQPLIINDEDAALEAEPSNVLQEAIEEFEKSNDPLADSYTADNEQTWSVLAGQVVGQESF
jgi:hypothetical protein